ncbi:SET domain-containing protein [Suillus paluster]|uniref:SET domain-containing protein n=1 Tax=Suillus paluster TaxID=48578 RepID=UPI001B883FFB|nr:SET domain-containing protein [Suillus paluster]KAG1731608.1 SET domain-containing protein [Suillus paluster]
MDSDSEPILYIDRTEGGDLFNSKPRSSESIKLRELGLQIYKEVWKEFYKWEPRECQRVIDSFAGRRVPGAQQKYNKMIDQLFDPALQDSEMQENPNRSSLIVTQYDADGRGISYPLEVVEISVDPTFESHPPYESCPPINQSIKPGRQLSDKVLFIPYADDEDFPVDEYLEPFPCFAWEEDFDPDLEMIQIETVRRLDSIHNISPKDIDRMDIFKPLRELYNGGLLWERHQRDFLHWPGRPFDTERDLESSFEPAVDNLCQRLSSLLATFCPNLNCLRTLCTTHSHPRSALFGGVRPKVTSQSMRLSEGEPCGEECFRLTDESYMDKVYWENESDKETLKTILSISPDLFPCQLAVLCFKPCREVFVQRSHIFPEHSIYDDDPTGDEESHTQNRRTEKKARKPRLDFEDASSHEKFAPIEPCNHKGPCEDAQCRCYSQKRHCQLACRCGIKCVRQFRGCKCKRCHSKTCPCVKHTRECLPGICTNCDAKGATEKPCENTRLQRNDAKAVEIKRAKFGLGAFAAENMKRGDYIGDYVGIFMKHEDADYLHDITNYSHRNYLFEFSPNNFDEMFDAAPVGNATRFLNHSPAAKANCTTEALLVNGEHHIGFYTTKAVARGQELVFHYGSKYWSQEQGSEPLND